MVDVEASTLDALVNFCYSGKIMITEDNSLSILAAACRFQLDKVQGLCCEFLKENLGLSNCLEIHATADAHSCQELFLCAEMYIVQNFQKVAESENFNQLSFDRLVKLISREELNVQSEEQGLCCEFLKENLGLSNCLEIHATADAHSCQELFLCAEMYIVQNFQKVAESENFNQLSFDRLVKLISREELNVQSEEQLLEHVRLASCHPKFLVGTELLNFCDYLLTDHWNCKEGNLANHSKQAKYYTLVWQIIAF
ncbi:BTB And Kelch, partial [Cooperia oncophora]